jgi:FixJ family two-component response regulator
LLDVHLQGVDGFELQRTLAEHEEQSVFKTGNGDVPTCARARKGGGRVDDKAFLAAVSR